MQEAAGGGPEAGWHPDPQGRHQQRYWDGTVWTMRVADNGVEVRDTAAQTSPRTVLKRVNYALYSAMLWGGLGAIVVSFVISAVFPSSSSNPANPLQVVVGLLALVGVVSIVFALVYYWICVYRCWAVLQGFTARTTPGAAIGFLFIPFFNIYWVWQAIQGLAVDANAYSRARRIDRNISVGLASAICVLTLLGIIPYVGYVTAFVTLTILNPIFLYQVAGFTNQAILQREQSPA